MASPERPGESQSLVLSKPYGKQHRGSTFRLERLKYFFQLYIHIDVRSGHFFKGKQGNMHWNVDGTCYWRSVTRHLKRGAIKLSQTKTYDCLVASNSMSRILRSDMTDFMRSSSKNRVDLLRCKSEGTDLYPSLNILMKDGEGECR